MSKGKSIGYCKTCGSEIVETVNDSQFRDGECNACEYERYRSQPKLLASAELVVSRWKRGHLAEAVRQLQIAIEEVL